MITNDTPERVEQSEVSPWKTGARYGLLASLVLVVLGLVFHLTGLVEPGNSQGAGTWIANLLNWGVMAAAIFLAARQHRDEELGGYMTYGRGVGIGSIASLVMAVVILLWTILFMTVIVPDMVDTIRYQMEEQMREQQGMSEEQVEQAMGIAGAFASAPVIAATAGVFTFVLGLIFSLIISAVMKKDPPETA